MRKRMHEYGNKNLIGRRVEQLRKKNNMRQGELLVKLQINGIDISASGLSKLEGQIRAVTDFELLALANIFGISIDNLVGRNLNLD